MSNPAKIFLTLTLALGLALTLSSGTGVLADGGAGHQTPQPYPIQLGTSGGNIFDISMLYCCSGTLGTLVKDGNGTQYILSNNHVLARFNAGAIGDPINQPGMIDQQCAPDGAIAALADFVKIQVSKGRKIKENLVDAAIAEVIPGLVRSDGAILDIGPVSGSVVAAFVNQAVQKSGRTTGHTTGTVSAIDVTVDVGYSKECGGPANQVARFVNQIRITPGSFSDGGDSGSAIIESGVVDPVDNLPRTVGLLFAGSSTSTLANPIDPILNLLGVTMVSGVPLPPAATGSISGTVVSSADDSPIAGATVSTDTGQATTTNGSGFYLIDNVPVGDRTVSASATGFVTGAQNATVVEDTLSLLDFSLEVALAPAQAVVGCVIFDTQGGKGGTKHLLFTIHAVDDFGNPISGAVVDIDVVRDGAPFGSGTGATTNANGDVTYTSKNAASGVYEITVTNIAAAGLVFDSASTPANAFAKGTDPVPATFCNDGISPSLEAADIPELISRARAAKARNSARLMGINGVVGHGVGLSESGRPVIEVYVGADNAAMRAQIPVTLENVPVRVVVTGAFEAY